MMSVPFAPAAVSFLGRSRASWMMSGTLACVMIAGDSVNVSPSLDVAKWI
jgi:hypothetical protein